MYYISFMNLWKGLTGLFFMNSNLLKKSSCQFKLQHDNRHCNNTHSSNRWNVQWGQVLQHYFTYSARLKYKPKCWRYQQNIVCPAIRITQHRRKPKEWMMWIYMHAACKIMLKNSSKYVAKTLECKVYHDRSVMLM